MPYLNDSDSDNDSDYYDHDPGREVVERNTRNRLQRIANHTKYELNKVLKRVDSTLSNYEYSVQASLMQHGMTMDQMSNIEHVADLKELEDLLNDNIAKQKYKQRLMVFIVGQTEQVSEKAKLLQQIEQFFNEQKRNFSGKEFNTYDDRYDNQDEIDLQLQSFDVKDCYVHVQNLGDRLTELNDDIVRYLIENAGAKQQAKGKKKLAQITKESKDQLTSLQAKLEQANNEMINRDIKINTFEQEIEKLTKQAKTNANKLEESEKEIESLKNHIKELEDSIQQYKYQMEELNKNLATELQSEIDETADRPTTVDSKKSEETHEKSVETIDVNQTEKDGTQSIVIPDDGNQASYHLSENSEPVLLDNINDVNIFLNSTDGIDFNNVTDENLPTAFTSLKKLTIIRIRELLKELKMKEWIHNETVQQFEEYKRICRFEQNDLIEIADSAYQLQIKAQKTAEEAMDHLKYYIVEQEKMKEDIIHQETQTDVHETTSTSTSPEEVNPIEELSHDDRSSHSKMTTEEFESVENFRRRSLKEKYISLIEEKKRELEQLKQQAETILSRPSSIKRRLSLPSLEDSTALIKQPLSLTSFNSTDFKENPSTVQLITKQDIEQQTTPIPSRRPSTTKQPIVPQMIQSDEFKNSFIHIYDMIHKFRQSIINLLEHNKFNSFADCLYMIRQLSFDDNNNSIIDKFIDNAERVLKDIIKVLQTSMKSLQTTIEEYKTKEKEPEPILETSTIDNNQQSIILEQREAMIIELTTKYEQVTKALNDLYQKHEEESNQHVRVISEQQKLIQSLQQELIRLQKNLTKIQSQGIVEPSIMFTRLDAERNEQTLQKAIHTGRVPEKTYNELNDAMADYNEIPSRQFSNLVKRYIQFRKATELEDRIQSEILNNDTKSGLEKIGSFYERQSDHFSREMSHLRQQRVKLAEILTEKFDNLEEESNIFLIRPVYSYQGRAAVQSYMKQENRRREVLNANIIRKKHYPSRLSNKTHSSSDNQSNDNQQNPRPLSSLSSNDETRVFRIEKTFPPLQPSVSETTTNNTKHITVQLNDLTRLEELDFQRPLLPVLQATTPLLPHVPNNGVDPSAPSISLRSYLALSRPGVDHIRMDKKSNEPLTPVPREGFSALSLKSHPSHPRTPYNSSAGGSRRVAPSLPLIQRSLTSSVAPMITKKKHNAFYRSASTNEVSTND